MADLDWGDAPYVCPGCYAVGGERCATGCIDDEMDREREEGYLRGDYERFDDEEDPREVGYPIGEPYVSQPERKP